jgi:hypothetical protein
MNEKTSLYARLVVRRLSPVLWLDLAVKIALLSLLLLAVLEPDLPQF